MKFRLAKMEKEKIWKTEIEKKNGQNYEKNWEDFSQTEGQQTGSRIKKTIFG